MTLKLRAYSSNRLDCKSVFRHIIQNNSLFRRHSLILKLNQYFLEISFDFIIFVIKVVIVLLALKQILNN